MKTATCVRDIEVQVLIVGGGGCDPIGTSPGAVPSRLPIRPPR
jgi:hypothetical protein